MDFSVYIANTWAILKSIHEQISLLLHCIVCFHSLRFHKHHSSEIGHDKLQYFLITAIIVILEWDLRLFYASSPCCLSPFLLSQDNWDVHCVGACCLDHAIRLQAGIQIIFIKRVQSKPVQSSYLVASIFCNVYLLIPNLQFDLRCTVKKAKKESCSQIRDATFRLRSRLSLVIKC